MIIKDDWLSEQLGKSVFNLSERMDLDGDFTTHGLYCYRTDSEKSLGVAIQKGFGLISIAVQLEIDCLLKRQRSPGIYTPYWLPSLIMSRDRILSIVEKCFIYDRFHKDSRIGKEKADALKRAWAINYLEGERGDKIFQIDGGFLFALIENIGDGKIAVIDLIGIDPDLQGRGRGSILVSKFIDYYAWLKGITRLGVSTQLDNLPSLALYQKCGFRIVGSHYVLHLHT